MAREKNTQEMIDAEKKAVVDALGAGWEGVESGKNLKLAEGERVTGRIVRTPYPMGKSYAFDIEIEDGDVVSYWSQTILTNLFKKIKDGDVVTIQRIKDIPTPNGDAADFVMARKAR